MKHLLIWICLCVFANLLNAQYDFVISTGGVVTASGGFVTMNNASLINSGNFEATNNEVIFTGTVPKADAVIGGIGTTSFWDLTINKTANDVQLYGIVFIDNLIYLDSGNVDLDGSTLELDAGTSGGEIIGESESTRIYDNAGTGAVKKVYKLSGPTNVNPGNIGLSFTTPHNLGTTTIMRRHYPFWIEDHNGVERYFQIMPDHNFDDVQLRFFYLDAEKNGLSENSLSIWHYDGFNYERESKDGYNIFGNYVETNSGRAHGTLTLALNNSYAQPRIFLQGPYDAATNKMDAYLAQNGLIPSTEPYSAMGFTGIQNAGETLSIPAAFPAFPLDENIIDWVLVEIRDATTPSLILAKRAALLRRDGQITSDPFGLRAIGFTNIPAGNYHLSVRHRNHLGVMTQLPLSFE